MNFRVTRFNKAIVAGLALILDTLNAAMGDSVFDMNEKQHLVTTIISIGLGVWAVWRVPNAKTNTPEDAPDA